jgi:hypothetical protein
LGDENARRLHDPFTAAKSLLESDWLDWGITLLKGEDVGDVAASPLVDCLVITSHDTDISTCLGQQIDDAFLNRVHILVFIYDYMPNTLAQPLFQFRIVCEGLHCFEHDRGIVQVPTVGQEMLARLQAVGHRASAELGLI